MKFEAYIYYVTVPGTGQQLRDVLQDPNSSYLSTLLFVAFPLRALSVVLAKSQLKFQNASPYSG